MNKQPLQTAGARQRIIDAFWELAAIQGIDRVTISATAKRAGLNRGTFYVYFADMPDLLKQIEDEIVADLKERMKIAVREGGFDDFGIASKKMLEVFNLYDDKIFMLIGKNGDPDFRALIMEDASRMFSDMFTGHAHSDYILVYLVSAFMGLLTYWHENGKKISAADFTQIVHTLATKGIHGVLEMK